MEELYINNLADALCFIFSVHQGKDGHNHGQLHTCIKADDCSSQEQQPQTPAVLGQQQTKATKSESRS